MSGERYKPVEWFVNLSPATGSTGSKFGSAVEEAIGLVQGTQSKISQEFIDANGPIQSYLIQNTKLFCVTVYSHCPIPIQMKCPIPIILLYIPMEHLSMWEVD